MLFKRKKVPYDEISITDDALFRVITSPHPNECIGQRLFENIAIAVIGFLAEYVTVVVTFCLESCRSAFVGHDPVVIGLFGVVGPQVIF